MSSPNPVLIELELIGRFKGKEGGLRGLGPRRFGTVQTDEMEVRPQPWSYSADLPPRRAFRCRTLRGDVRMRSWLFTPTIVAALSLIFAKSAAAQAPSHVGKGPLAVAIDRNIGS